MLTSLSHSLPIVAKQALATALRLISS